jgi:dihydrofolate reductase
MSNRRGNMKGRRKIIAYIATSADGYIARPDGDVDWLSRPQPKGNYGIRTFFKSIDTILWGRKTYAKGIEMGMKDAGVGPGLKNYVFSRHPETTLLAGFELVKEPIRLFVRRLRARSGKNVWMMGGGEIIGAFLDEGEIDEFSIHVIPILIGEGIPLIQPRHRSIPLKLLSTKKFPDGVVHLHYGVTAKQQWDKKSRPHRAFAGR